MTPSHARRSAERRGATVVEFAIVASVLFMIIFAMIEFSRANMLVHTCRIAATEGARKGVVPGARASACKKAAQAELDMLNIRGGKVTVSPSTITPETTEVTVTVTAPLDGANGYVFPRFFLGKIARSRITLRRETADFN